MVIQEVLERREQGDPYSFIAHDLFGSSKFSERARGIVRRHKDKKEVQTPEDNSRILLISDLHIPYHHPQAFDFLRYLKNKYKPTRVICLGDECDGHSMSYHEKSPELLGAGDELRLTRKYIKELESIFPEMDILESNHGSLVYRKAKTHGIPKDYIRDYNEVLGVGDGWKWHFDMTIQLPDGTYCYLHHGKSTDVIKLSKQMGMHAVQGHHHTNFNIQYWSNPNNLLWAMACGCLIDKSSLAFAYGNVNISRPVIGTGLIINSQPILVPMLLDKKGNWRRDVY